MEGAQTAYTQIWKRAKTEIKCINLLSPQLEVIVSSGRLADLSDTQAFV